jgi:hypothetical protein
VAAPGTPSGNCGRPGGLPPGSSRRCCSGSSSVLARSSGGRITAPLDVLLNVCEFTGWCLSTLSRPQTFQSGLQLGERHRQDCLGGGRPGRARRGPQRGRSSGSLRDRAPAPGACRDAAQHRPASPPTKDGPPGPVRPSEPRTHRRRDLRAHRTAYPAPAPLGGTGPPSGRRHAHPVRRPCPQGPCVSPPERSRRAPQHDVPSDLASETTRSPLSRTVRPGTAGIASVPQEGVEPPTKRLEGSCSIH